MYVLLPDVYLTRRQRLHFVMDEAGVLLWSGKTIGAAIRFLHGTGVTRFKIDGQEPDEAFIVEVSPI